MVKILPDTHILLWLTIQPQRLSPIAQTLLQDPANELYFSVASIWEIAIKKTLGRAGFDVEPAVLQRRLIEIGFAELPISSLHAFGLSGMPHIHKDPFDRLLIAQATAEGLLLLTADPVVARYPGPVRRV